MLSWAVQPLFVDRPATQKIKFHTFFSFHSAKLGTWMYKQMKRISTKNCILMTTKLAKDQNHMKQELLGFLKFFTQHHMNVCWNMLELFVHSHAHPGTQTRDNYGIQFSCVFTDQIAMASVFTSDIKKWNSKNFLTHTTPAQTCGRTNKSSVFQRKIMKCWLGNMKKPKIVEFWQFWVFASFFTHSLQLFVETCFICLCTRVCILASCNEKKFWDFIFWRCHKPYDHCLWIEPQHKK